MDLNLRVPAAMYHIESVSLRWCSFPAGEQKLTIGAVREAAKALALAQETAALEAAAAAANSGDTTTDKSKSKKKKKKKKKNSGVGLVRVKEIEGISCCVV